MIYSVVCYYFNFSKLKSYISNYLMQVDNTSSNNAEFQDLALLNNELFNFCLKAKKYTF